MIKLHDLIANKDCFKGYYVDVEYNRNHSNPKQIIDNKPSAINYASTTGIWSLFALSLSVSMDALTVGVSLGVYKFAIPLAVVLIGITAGAMTASGLLLGKKFGLWLGSKAEFAGGAILIIIGIKQLM